MADVRAVALTRGVALAAVALTVAACDGRTRLVVRTDLPEELRQAAETTFEHQHPDVDVHFSVEADSISVRELAAAESPAFDVWWASSEVRLEAAARSGRLVGWQPLRASPLVFAFDRNEVAIGRAPRDWMDLLHLRWVDELAVPDPGRSDIGAFLVGAIVSDRARREGSSWIGFEWLERLDEQVAAYVRDEHEALRSVRLGMASLAVVRLATVEAARAEDDALYYRIPESGGPAPLMGAGRVATTGQPEAADRFVAHLAQDGMGTDAWPAGWRPVEEADPGDLAMIVDSLSTWLDRWDLEVRGRGM